MKKNCTLLFFISFFITQLIAQQPTEKIKQTISVFPYQHVSEASASLNTMKDWKKAEWKQLIQLLNQDSTKLKASYALNAYIHQASMEQGLKTILLHHLKSLKSVATSEYARIFLESQLTLLANQNNLSTSLNALPSLPVKQVMPKVDQRNDAEYLLLLQDQMESAANPLQRRSILNRVAAMKGIGALMFAGKFLKDPQLDQAAAKIAVKIALNDATVKGSAVREILDAAKPLIHGEDSASLMSALDKLLKKMPYDFGFVNLFNGRDLSGWKGLVANPIARSKMTEAELKAAQEKADEQMRKGWTVKDGLLIFTGHGDNLATVKQYADMEMYVDWKITEKGDAGIYLRGSPQVQIWDTSRREVGAQVGSGGLYNNQKNESKPLVVADHRIGTWNTFHIIMQGNKVTVYLNGVLVTDHVVLENYWDRNLPIFAKEQIELQAHGTYVAYRNIYLREIPGGEAVVLSEAEKKEGFQSLFNGMDLQQWIGNTTGYIVKDGAVEVNPEAGGGGNLYTKEEYSDFIYRFDFQLTPGANNGIGIRAPLEGDAAYTGMEIQVLDSEHPMYQQLQPYQYHGSVYGVIPARRGFLLPTGEWNQEEIMIKGDKIKVTLNGTVIVEGDLKEASSNGTMDHKEHPGLRRTSGHIGFLGHGDVVRFKNMRIRKL